MMFGKVLIANRGEIAVRVIRACRDLGIATVAIYSEADRGALHVRLADEAWCCGPPKASDSYLAIDRILELVERSGADAVHPGYGFLAENGDFADACLRCGATFIGPSSEVLRSMGDKVASRRIMRDAGVPVVPGSALALTDEEAAAYAREIGLPVMVKASRGGGGRGLRLVAAEKDLAPAIERARSEAASAFGSDVLYVEKFIESSRHIEIQILADAEGNVVHLFERDCSIQRRHQKILEEAPACGIDDAQRSALGEAAVKAAQSVGYQGAGTVEFLLDPSGAFYFLEMNTRVQVEHPVTEEITSVDIVKEMIALAAGDPLSVSQNDLSIRGHAIEARIYAEDPESGFLPSPGDISVFRPPDGVGIRVDAGVAAGDTVTPHYDAMLAKLVAWGRDRDEAIARLDRALGEFAVGGIKTSIAFHRRILANPAFRAGRYDTGFVADEMNGGRPEAGDGEHCEALDRDLGLDLALVLVALTHGFRGAQTVRQKGRGGGEFEVAVDEDGRIAVDGRSIAVDAAPGVAGAWSLIVDGRQQEAIVAEKRPGRYEVCVGATTFLFEIPAP